MTIEKHPIEGYPTIIPQGKIIEGEIEGIHYIAISREEGFALRSSQAKAGDPDAIIPIGDVIEFDNATRLVSMPINGVSAGLVIYDQVK